MANILIVDDDRLVRESLCDALVSRGHRVSVAANGREGLMKLSKTGFDLVITDLIMPEMDGFELMRTLHEKTPGVKILAISGGGRNCNLQFLDVAQDLGAMETLTKPVKLDEFYRVIEACLAGSFERAN